MAKLKVGDLVRIPQSTLSTKGVVQHVETVAPPNGSLDKCLILTVEGELRTFWSCELVLIK